MKIQELPIQDAKLIEPVWYQDDRGAFARSFCIETLQSYGISFQIQQCNISTNLKKERCGGCIGRQNPKLREN